MLCPGGRLLWSVHNNCNAAPATKSVEIHFDSNRAINGKLTGRTKIMIHTLVELSIYVSKHICDKKLFHGLVYWLHAVVCVLVRDVQYLCLYSIHDALFTLLYLIDNISLFILRTYVVCRLTLDICTVSVCCWHSSNCSTVDRRTILERENVSQARVLLLLLLFLWFPASQS